MKFRVRFVWNKTTARNPHARALHGWVRVVENESTKGRYKTLWFDARKVLALIAVAAVACWLGGAGALYWRLQQNHYNRVRFADLALPWRWSGITELRGQGYLAAGMDRLARGEIADGIFDIRQGVKRHPDAADARLAVARVFVRAGYYRGARDMLLPQLDQPSPLSREFVRFFVDMAAASDDRSTILTVCDRLLAQPTWTDADRTWLQEKRASALCALARYEEAIAVVEAMGENRSLDARGTYVTALCGAGRAADACRDLQSWDNNIPEEFRLQWLVYASRRAGRMGDMRDAVKRLQTLHPTNFQPWTQAIEEYTLAGWHDEAAAQLRDCLLRFGGTRGAMDMVERACAAAGAQDLLEMFIEDAHEHGRAISAALLDLTVLLVRKGEFARAERTLQRLLVVDERARSRSPAAAMSALSQNAPMRVQEQPLPDVVKNWLRTLIAAAAMPARDPAEAHCVVLDEPRLPRTLAVISAEALAANGHWPAVAAVTRVGLRRFPNAAALERWSARAAEQIAAMPPEPKPGAVLAKTAEAAPAEKAPDTLTVRRPKFDSPADLFAQLDELTRREAWAEAEDMIKTARAERPEWLAQIDGELAWREVRGAFEQRKQVGATQVLAARLRLRPLESPRAVALARDWLARGEHGTALRIAELIVAEVPEFKPGRSLLAELKATDAK